jgi:hypothetical protein
MESWQTAHGLSIFIIVVVTVVPVSICCVVGITRTGSLKFVGTSPGSTSTAAKRFANKSFWLRGGGEGVAKYGGE